MKYANIRFSPTISGIGKRSDKVCWLFLFGEYFFCNAFQWIYLLLFCQIEEDPHVIAKMLLHDIIIWFPFSSRLMTRQEYYDLLVSVKSFKKLMSSVNKSFVVSFFLHLVEVDHELWTRLTAKLWTAIGQWPG